MHPCCSHAEPVSEVHSCCSHAEPVAEAHSCCSHAEPVSEVHSCCSHETAEDVHLSLGQKIIGIFTYAFDEFIDEIAVNFVVGLLIAALISTVLPAGVLATFTNPLVSMLLMLVIGIPMYVCSTASIPIAVSLIAKGITPGAAFVFLFAGPVTNIASLTILGKTLGKKVMAVYLSAVAGCSIAFGLLLDFILTQLQMQGFENAVCGMHTHDIPL